MEKKNQDDLMGLTPEEYKRYKELTEQYQIVVKNSEAITEEAVYDVLAQYINRQFGERIVIKRSPKEIEALKKQKGRD